MFQLMFQIFFHYRGDFVRGDFVLDSAHSSQAACVCSSLTALICLTTDCTRLHPRVIPDPHVNSVTLNTDHFHRTCSHTDDVTDTSASKLSDVLIIHSLLQHVQSSTHTGGHTLDLFITRHHQPVAAAV